MPKRKRLQNNHAPAPTLHDVAELAEVSTATVSRYLSNADLVREERRNRIRTAVEKLGYIPHGAAQALASQRSRTIGVIVPTLDNAIFAKGIQAFQEHLQNAGYTLFIASSDYSPDKTTIRAYMNGCLQAICRSSTRGHSIRTRVTHASVSITSTQHHGRSNI